MPSYQVENMSGQETDTGVINLSNRHLRRIDCLPKGISPSTLLLSNNEISKVENLQYFAHLQQLSLSGNHIVDMKGVSAAQGLRVLDLSNNSIVCIEGISSLRSLEWVNFSGNSIEEIVNLERNTNLNHLDLSDNSIAVISGLRTLKKLKTLLLHGNLISSLAVIKEQLSGTVCTLSLADNEISDLNEMRNLSFLVNLEQLSIVNNPCVLTSSSWRLEISYRPYLAYCCPNLRNLDGHLVTNQERVVARVLNHAFHQIGHPSPGQHIQLVSILHHICTEPAAANQTSPEDYNDDLEGNNLLESESFYIPVPLSDVEEQMQTDDPIMTEEEALRLLSLAATIIQAHVRGHLVRKKFDFCQYRRQKHAASCIQAAWKGYCARTKDIRVVNIRNELRVRRLISTINHLHGQLQREHEEAVKSREQFKTAIKYLWCQITKQKKVNQLQLHKQQVKAAIKIQAWWRGYMSRKAFPHVYKQMHSNKVSELFTLCHNLQMQLDVFKSQVTEITEGDKPNKEFQLDDHTVLEGQGLDSGELNRDGSSSLSQLSAKEDTFGVPVVHQSDATHEKADFPSDKEEKPEFRNDSLEPEVNIMTPSTADQINQDMYKAVLPNSDQADIGVNKPASSNSSIGHQEDSIDVRTVPHVGDTYRDGSDEEQSADAIGLEMNKVVHTGNDQGSGQEGKSVMSSTAQHEQHENKASPGEGHLEGNMASSKDPSSTVEESRGSQLVDRAQQQQVGMDDRLQASVPEIVVSSPVPTDDESSNEGSAVEDVDEMPMDAEQQGLEKQMAAEQQLLEKQNIAEYHSNADFSWKPQSSEHEDLESHTSAADPSTVPTENKQEGDVSERSHLALKSTANYFASTEASSGKRDEEPAAAQSSCGAAQGSVPNLGERASNLLSQLRSEIASMKSARLSSVLPIIASEDANESEVDNNQDYTDHEPKTATAILTSQEYDSSESVSQDRDICQVTPRERDTSQEYDTYQVASLECDTSEKPSQELNTFQVTPQVRDSFKPASQERSAFQVIPHELGTCSQERDTSESASQERDTFQPPSQGRDTSQPGIRLPLFEDVDSACTSFSLDDFISDPTTEEASNLSSHIGYRYDEHEGEI